MERRNRISRKERNEWNQATQEEPRTREETIMTGAEIQDSTG